ATHNTITSSNRNGSVVGALGEVFVSSSDTSAIDAEIITASGGVGLAGIAVGVALTENTVANTVSSSIEDATATASTGDINVLADAAQAVKALSVNTALSISIGAAGAGSDSRSTINGVVEAFVARSTLTAGAGGRSDAARGGPA